MTLDEPIASASGKVVIPESKLLENKVEKEG
jgi:hypothetical protein